MEQTRKTVAIAGATGFVGRALTDLLLPNYNVIGLKRGTLPGACTIVPGRRCPVEWRRCDLFSMQQCEKGLAGADVAFYLVHSMLPSAQLTQGSFDDTDLIMADNFARAARKCDVKHIVFLGGLVPDEGNLSRHLRSRQEVEQTLGSYGVPLTALRAGVVVGPGGSSIQMIINIVKRLPVIPCPKMAENLTQPVALDDVLRAMCYIVANPPAHNESYDVGGPDVLSYSQMIARTAAYLSLPRKLVWLPFSAPFLIKRLVAAAAQAPMELVAPLVESMKHSTVARDNSLFKRAGIKPLNFEDALQLALERIPERQRHKCCRPEPNWHRIMLNKDVRSVQRLVLPPGRSAAWVANEYGKWHPRIFGKILVGTADPVSSNVTIRLFGKITLLSLTFVHKRSDNGRQLFFVDGGVLVHLPSNQDPMQRSRLEFREVLGKKYILIALHDYFPTLPWPIYYSTQALIHLWFIKKFGNYLQNAKSH